MTAVGRSANSFVTPRATGVDQRFGGQERIAGRRASARRNVVNPMTGSTLKQTCSVQGKNPSRRCETGRTESGWGLAIPSADELRHAREKAACVRENGGGAISDNPKRGSSGHEQSWTERRGSKRAGEAGAKGHEGAIVDCGGSRRCLLEGPRGSTRIVPTMRRKIRRAAVNRQGTTTSDGKGSAEKSAPTRALKTKRTACPDAACEGTRAHLSACRR